MSHQRDITLLFSTRIIRLFCYGFLSVILALYLAETGFDEKQIGLLFTLTLMGDAGILFGIPTLFNTPLFLAGGLKIVYDLLLFKEFHSMKPPEENQVYDTKKA
jgi:hypothetical protein